MGGVMLKKNCLRNWLSLLHHKEKKFNHYINHPQEIEDVLQKGALKAKKVADSTLNRVRECLGYNS